MFQKRWSDDKIETLRELWLRGDSAASIGREIGFSSSAVSKRATIIGLTRRECPIRPPKSWSPQQISDVERLLGEGMSMRQIALRCRVSASTIADLLHRMKKRAGPAAVTPLIAPVDTLPALPSLTFSDPKIVSLSLYQKPASWSVFQGRKSVCQWVERRSPLLMCGAPAVDDRGVWCSIHHAICYPNAAAFNQVAAE